MKDRLVIGSRGSKLALVQAETVKAQLVGLRPGLDITVEVVKTTGDTNNQPLSVIGGQGVFTKELEEALLSNRIDLAVHSLKDLPTVLPDKLSIAAICKREDPRDALVVRGDSRTEPSIRNLSSGAAVGTSSPRRLAQLKHLRPDLEFKEIRGNVDTRLRKLDEGQYDALVLAAAGLRRLGLAQRISSTIEPEVMLPAVGQGALAVETRADDSETASVVKQLDHERTRLSCLAERAMLRALGGGCQLPIAAHAIIDDRGTLCLVGLIAASDGSEVIKDEVTGPKSDAESLGNELGERLLSRGATRMLRDFS